MTEIVDNLLGQLRAATAHPWSSRVRRDRSMLLAGLIMGSCLLLALLSSAESNPPPAGEVQVPAYPVTGMETTAYSVQAAGKPVPVFDLWADGIHEKQKPIPEVYLAQ